MTAQKDRRTHSQGPSYPRPPLSPPTLFDPPHRSTTFAAPPRQLAFRPSPPPSPARSSLSRTSLQEERGAAAIGPPRHRRKTAQDRPVDEQVGVPRRIITRPRLPSAFGFATSTTRPMVPEASSFSEGNTNPRVDEFGRRRIHGHAYEGEPRGCHRKRVRRDIADFDPRPSAHSFRLSPSQTLPPLAGPYFTLHLLHVSPLHPGSPFRIQLHISPFALSHAPTNIHFELSARSIAPFSTHLLFSRKLVERIDPRSKVTFDARIPLGGQCESCGAGYGTLPPSFEHCDEGEGGYKTVYLVTATLGDVVVSQELRIEPSLERGMGLSRGMVELPLERNLETVELNESWTGFDLMGMKVC